MDVVVARQYDAHAAKKVKKFNLERDAEVRETGADDDTTEEYYAPDFIVAERVVACSVSKEDFRANPNGEEVLFLVKWLSLPYNECTWESYEVVDDEAAVEDFWARSVLSPEVGSRVGPCCCC